MSENPLLSQVEPQNIFWHKDVDFLEYQIGVVNKHIDSQHDEYKRENWQRYLGPDGKLIFVNAIEFPLISIEEERRIIKEAESEIEEDYEKYLKEKAQKCLPNIDNSNKVPRDERFKMIRRKGDLQGAYLPGWTPDRKLNEKQRILSMVDLKLYKMQKRQEDATSSTSATSLSSSTSSS